MKCRKTSSVRRKGGEWKGADGKGGLRPTPPFSKGNTLIPHSKPDDPHSSTVLVTTQAVYVLLPLQGRSRKVFRGLGNPGRLVRLDPGLVDLRLQPLSSLLLGHLRSRVADAAWPNVFHVSEASRESPAFPGRRGGGWGQFGGAEPGPASRLRVGLRVGRDLGCDLGLGGVLWLLLGPSGPRRLLRDEVYLSHRTPDHNGRRGHEHGTGFYLGKSYIVSAGLFLA